MKEMRMQGTGIDTGKWFVTYRTNLLEKKRVALQGKKLPTMIESGTVWWLSCNCRQLRRTHWCRVIVALSVKYSVAERWHSVFKCRIMLSSNARVQWQISQTYTRDQVVDTFEVESSVKRKFNGQLTQRCRAEVNGSTETRIEDEKFNTPTIGTRSTQFMIVMNRRNLIEVFRCHQWRFHWRLIIVTDISSENT